MSLAARIDAELLQAAGYPMAAIAALNRRQLFADSKEKAENFERLFRLQAELGLYGDALKSHATVLEDQTWVQVSDTITRAAAQMVALAGSEEPMSIELALDPLVCSRNPLCPTGSAHLDYTPLRRVLLPQLQKGALAAFQAQCERGTRALDPASPRWELPVEDGRCTLALTGAAGTVLILDER